MKNFYVTTPIYYPSGKFHIGTAYSTILADSLNRYHQLLEENTYFLTGTDCHGEKIQTSAKENNLDPLTYVTNMSDSAKKLWNDLKISNNDFIMTTDQFHQDAVKAIFTKLLNNDDIYLGHYEGNYCVSCESYFTKLQLADELYCPDCGKKTKLVKEESYFLRLSKYEKKLIKYIEENEDFIKPKTRRNEVLSFLKNGLHDLSVSRTSFDWGIKPNENPKHVIYVWLDALSNYISALGYNSDEKLMHFWNDAKVVQIVGKDILRFHAIYWPIMLMALDLKLPDTIYAHGWILMKDGKMSKSVGNVIYPDVLAQKYGVDATRYYLLKQLTYGNDAVFTPEDFVEIINTELINDYGNLVNRTIVMINKYFDGSLKYNNVVSEFDDALFSVLNKNLELWHKNMQNLEVDKAMTNVIESISRANKYIDETKPWILGRDESNNELLNKVLLNLVEAIRMSTIQLQAYLVEIPNNVFTQLNLDQEFRTLKSLDTKIKEIKVSEKAIPILNRLDKEVEIKFIASLFESTKEVVEEVKEITKLEEITFEEFSKIELKVGLVLECKKHPKADKLLISQIKIGNEIRQIISGIKDYYEPEEFIGQKVICVTNLKPVKLRGELSAGMILCASDENDLEIVSVTKLNDGAIVK